jgi:regulator of vacuolar morphogenesis
MAATTAIQAVYVRGHDERTEPKAHIVFRIDIQAHVRSWQMWRRYSEFADLHTELTKSVGAPPPSPLPPKHAFAMLRSPKNEALLEERRAGLEIYLRAIVSAKDSRWLDAFAFRDFLGIPTGKQAALPGIGDLSSTVGGKDGGFQFTSSTWLDEHMDLQSRVRDIRADINKRDAFSERGDVGGAHTTNVQAKKKLAGVLTRVGVLVSGLDALVVQSGMSEGELQRRTDMAGRLQDDCEKLAKMLTVASRQQSSSSSSAAARNVTAGSDRAALFRSGSGGGGGQPAVSSKPIARVFGVPQPPKETEETRPLDDHGLLQLQQAKMDQQDAQVSQLTTILQRQRQLGTAINNELAQHVELLDGLHNDMERVGGKLTGAKKQINRLG